MPHLPTPDLDNLIKAFKDCLMKQDSGVWYYGMMAKIWGPEGLIIVNPAHPTVLLPHGSFDHQVNHLH